MWRLGLQAALIGLAIALCAITAAAFGFHPARPDGDAWNYLAAGERLNAGHPLYVVGPGDRPVTLVPPYWSVPLLSPPPIAVAWRPLALLGDPAMVVWGVGCLLATLAGLAVLVLRSELRTAAIVAVLAAPLAIQGLSGNVNAVLFPLLLVAWSARTRPWVVGLIVAAAISIKLTPVLLLLWLISARRWRAVMATAAALAAIGVIALLGSSPDAFLDWLRLVPATTAPAPGSLAASLGVRPAVVLIALGLAVAAVALATRRDERWTFAAAVVATTLASPALYLGHVGLAAAALAPWLRTWPAIVRARRPNGESSSGDGLDVGEARQTRLVGGA
jgi:Glycosyltransferase family 87